jgi:hypothetical protein
MLHTTMNLEVGDLFINKYFSTSYQKDVLQVWLLKPAAEGEGLQWFQVCMFRVRGHVYSRRNCIIFRHQVMARQSTQSFRTLSLHINPRISMPHLGSSILQLVAAAKNLWS